MFETDVNQPAFLFTVSFYKFEMNTLNFSLQIPHSIRVKRVIL